MDWISVWIDIGAGLLIAGALAAWVPKHFWQAYFSAGTSDFGEAMGTRCGTDRRHTILCMLGGKCSAYGGPLEWRHQLRRCGCIPVCRSYCAAILDIYRKYYGLKISAFLLLIFYFSMALPALAVEFLFGALHLVPQERKAQIVEEVIRWNYPTILNVVFFAVEMLLVIRFLRTGGPAMLRMMSGSGQHEHDPSEGAHRHHGHA